MTSAEILQVRDGQLVNGELIYDAQAETIGLQQNIGGFVIPMQIRYPMIPLVTRRSKTSPLLRGIEAVRHAPHAERRCGEHD